MSGLWGSVGCQDICNKIFSPKIVWKIDWKIDWKIWKNVLENLLEILVGKMCWKICWKNVLKMLGGKFGNVGWKCVGWKMLVEHLAGKNVG